MPKEIVSTDDAPKGLAGYSQAVKANGLVFVSGQGPFDPATGNVVGETIQEQTRQCLRNVEAILKAARESGGELDRQRGAGHLHPRQRFRLPGNERGVESLVPRPTAGLQGAQLPIRLKGMRISIAAIATTS